MCVKCRMNRELSPGRKENLAVHESHPAASEDNIISSCSTVRSAKEVIFFMKKFVTLFTDSFRELKAVRTITTMAMLAAVAVILGFFSIEYGQFIRIGFSSIPNGIIDYLFGPVVGGIFHGALDIIKYMMKPTGPFCPQLTLVVILAGILYGCFFYKKKLTIWRVLAAKFVVMLVCNVILTTLCLNVLYGQAFMVILPARALKNLIMWPIDSVIFFAITKALEQIGLFRMFQKPVLANSANMQGN